MSEKLLKERELYNPDSTETPNTRMMFGGDPSGIINANDIKYQWAFSLWERMLENTWFPKEVNMVADAKDYKTLTDREKTAYDRALSQLIFMDSLQTVNIGKHIQPYITAPEIDICLVRQSFEEALHSFSYAVMVDSISANGNEIYNMFKVDPILRKKNEHIANTYKVLGENPTETNLLKSFFANQILEGIYFYSGFAYIYTLARSGKMLNSAVMIRFIQRDELCVHKDTELLTLTGWKNIADISTEDMVAQYDMENENITFEKPLRKIWRNHQGSMYKLVDNRGEVIQNITEGHDLVIKSKSTRTGRIITKKEKVEDSKFNQWKYIPNSGIGTGSNENELTPMEQLLVALQADGTIDTKRKGEISGNQVLKFGLSKERKIDRLKKILAEAGIEYNLSEKDNRDMYHFYVKLDNTLPFDKDFDWVDLSTVSYTWAVSFVEEIIHWDGSAPSDRESFFWSTTNKKAFDKVQAVMSLAGIKFKSKEKVDNRKDSYKNMHTLRFWMDTNHIQTQSLDKIEYQYDDMVGCVTMPKGTIITRYNDNVSITGNCHLELFSNSILEVYRERADLFTPELYADVYKMYEDAVNLEIEWGKYITQGQVLGLTDDIISNYIKFLADQRMYVIRNAGFKKIYNVENPIKWVDDFSKFNNQKGNFFETNILNYAKNSLEIDDF